MGDQRDAIVAGDDLERRRKGAPAGVPVDGELAPVDCDMRFAIARVRDRPGTEQHLSGGHLRRAIARELGAQAHRQRQIRVDLPVAETQREEKIAHHDLARLDADRAAAFTERLDARQQHPRAIRVVRADAQHHLAGRQPGQAQIDLLEFGLLPVAQILDHEASALETDLAQVAPVETERAHAVEPGQDGGEIVEAAARRGRRRRGGELAGREIPEWLRLGGRQHRGTRERTLVGRRKNRDVAILLDPHRELGAHQIEAFGARVAAQQAEAGEPDLGARRARDHDPIAVAHHDIADAQAGAPVLVALEHGAADLDAVAITEIFLDRRREPVGREIERDGSAREPVKQCPHDDRDDGHQGGHRHAQVAHAPAAQKIWETQPSSQPGAAPETRQAARRRFRRRRTVVRQQALFQAA